MLRQYKWSQGLVAPKPFPGHLQLRHPPQSIHPVDAHPTSFTLEEDVNPSIAIPGILGRAVARGHVFNHLLTAIEHPGPLPVMPRFAKLKLRVVSIDPGSRA